MKSNSEKQSMSFYLPSLSMGSSPYEELVYHQNKFIVYTQQNSKKRSPSNLSSSKTSVFPSRPNTTATFNHRFSPKNQLTRNRNQQSIDKFIQTHQKINSIRYQSNNTLKKIKTNKYKLNHHQSLTQNQFLTKDQLDYSDFTKIQNIKFQRINHNHLLKKSHDNSSILKPQQTFMNEISISKNRSPQENDNHKLMKSIKSLGKLHTQRSIIEDKVNINAPLSVDRQKAPLQIKARNYFPLRKSTSMTPNQTSRFMKNSKLKNNFLEFKHKDQVKDQVKKQPEIKQQNLQKEKQNNGQSDVRKEKEVQFTKREDQNSIQYLFDPKFIYQMSIKFNPRFYYSSDDTQIKPLQQKKDQKCSNNEKIDQKVKFSIKSQPQMKLQDKNIDRFQQRFQIDMIQSIVQENMREMQEKLLKEEIQQLDQELSKFLNNKKVIQTQNNNSILTNSKEDSPFIEMNSTSPSNFLKIKDKKQQKKMILKRNKNQQFIQLDTNSLKRASIIDFLNDKYYKNVKDLYWKVVNQQKNSLQGKIQHQKFDQSQKLQYSNQINHRKINQSFLQGQNDTSPQQQTQLKYVDYEFPHQKIQIPKHFQQVNWLYFAPCQQSSLFPKQLKLPQNYIHKSTKKQFPLINLLNCLLTVNPKIIQRLIQPAYNNVFSIWLNIKGIFEPIFVDGYLPYDSKLNSLYGHSQQFLWVAVFIKAAAKIFGGYKVLQNLTFQQWGSVILGFQLEKLPKPSYEEIKNWGEEQFDDRIQEYFRKAQIKYQSFIIIRNKQTKFFSIIKSIKNNRIRFTDCDSSMKKHEISLFELLIDKNYELILVPQSKQFYHSSSDFQSFSQGNIVSYQIKVPEDKSWVKTTTGLSQNQNRQEQLMMNGNILKRRIIIYQIPISFKKHHKKEMTLKHVIDNKILLKSYYENKLNNTLLETYLPQMKKGQYKIFIECGNVKLNDYLQSHQHNINKWLKTEQSIRDDKVKLKDKHQIKNNKLNNKNLNNFITLTSNNKIQIKGGQSLIINSQTLTSQLIEDQNYRYFSPKAKNKTNQQFSLHD